MVDVSKILTSMMAGGTQAGGAGGLLGQIATAAMQNPQAAQAGLGGLLASLAGGAAAAAPAAQAPAGGLLGQLAGMAGQATQTAQGQAGGLLGQLTQMAGQATQTAQGQAGGLLGGLAGLAQAAQGQGGGLLGQLTNMAQSAQTHAQTSAQSAQASAESGLGGLLGGLSAALQNASQQGAGGLGGFLGQASDLLKNNAGGFAGGAAAGTLAGLLLGTGAGRQIAGTAAKLGGLAAVGGLAYVALQNWQAGKPVVQGTIDDVMKLLGMGQLPQAAGGDESSMATIMLRSMVAAAFADGEMSDDERQAIVGQLDAMGLSDTEKAFVDGMIASPMSIADIAAACTSDEMKAQAYIAAHLGMHVDGAAEAKFLQDFATALGLDRQLVAHLDQAAAEAKAAKAA